MDSNKNIVFRCTFHVVWCTKYRRKLLTPEVEARLKQIAAEVAEETRCTIREMEGNLDHFHMLVDCDPQFGIHRFVKAVKGRSSRLLRQELHTHHVAYLGEVGLQPFQRFRGEFLNSVWYNATSILMERPCKKSGNQSLVFLVCTK